MSYKVNITKSVQKELINIETEQYLRIVESLKKLEHSARPHGCLKLRDRDGWRLRIGDYRIIYEIDDKAKQVNILHIGHRKDIYL